MFNKKITLYNNKSNTNKKNGTTKAFLMVIIIAVLVIVFVQSVSISTYSSANNESPNIINNNNNNNNNDQEKKVDIQQELIENKQNNLFEQQVDVKSTPEIEQSGTQTGQQQLRLYEEQRKEQEGINNDKEINKDNNQDNNQDNNSNKIQKEEKKEEEEEKDDNNRVQFQKMTDEQKLIFAEHSRKLRNKVRQSPYAKREKQPAEIENDKLTKQEREHLQRVVIQEWKDEVEILQRLGFDPGYASIIQVPESYNNKPTGDELVKKSKDNGWKLNKEENPFLLPKPHIFIHVPKTAGSSLGTIFRKNEKRDYFSHYWMTPNYNELETMVKRDTIFGHVRYGLHNYFERVDPNRVPPNQYGLNKYSYITMLREPVDRVVSNYYYHRQNRKDPFHDLAMKYELKDWIKVSAAANNEQARMICGLGWSDFGNQTIYDMAHHHLKYTFKHVGITEDFVGSLVLLTHYAGLQNIRFSKINTGRQRVSVEQIPQEIIDEIKERNWIDMSLYEMALDIYNKQIDQIGRELFESEVKEYKSRFMTRYSVPTNGPIRG